MACLYQNCGREVVGRFAGVPMCKEHYKAVSDETNHYYYKRITDKERTHWYRIKRFSYWKNH